MTNIARRRRFHPWCGVLLLGGAAFASEEAPEAASGKPERYDPVIELPLGSGRDLVLEACTKCHTLEGLEAYKGYWGRPQWFAMVEGMVKNGAKLDPAQMNTVVDYLTAHFGPDSP